MHLELSNIFRIAREVIHVYEHKANRQIRPPDNHRGKVSSIRANTNSVDGGIDRCNCSTSRRKSPDFQSHGASVPHSLIGNCLQSLPLRFSIDPSVIILSADRNQVGRLLHPRPFVGPDITSQIRRVSGEFSPHCLRRNVHSEDSHDLSLQLQSVQGARNDSSQNEEWVNPLPLRE
jgi:hypothetical protein